MDGLTHCRTAMSLGGTAMTAIIKAVGYSTYCAIPTNSTTTTAGTVTMTSPKTSGWYLPSIGQCYHWMKMCIASVTGSESVTYREASGLTTGVGTSQDFSYRGKCVAYTTELNTFFSNKGLQSYIVSFPTTGWWWHTSTENYANATIIFNWDGNHVYFDGRQGYGDKNNPGNTSHPTGVWSVLAF